MTNGHTAAGTALSIRLMSRDDLEFCARLVEQAGWNQVEEDWLRMMSLAPAGCFVAELNGEAVATTTTCCFGSCAWIAMVLVDKNFRHRGIARQMLLHAIGYLEHQQMATIRLDATSLGKGLYEQLGFTNEYEVIRYVREPQPGEMPAPVPSIDLSSLGQILALDKRATATDRDNFLRKLLWQKSSPAVRIHEENGQTMAYAASRPGRLATQLGPAVAIHPKAGMEALNRLLHALQNQKCMIDIPLKNNAATVWAIENGFVAKRSFTRMYLGKKIVDSPENIWASSGPEMG